MLRGYPAGLLTILGALNKPSLGVNKSLRKDLDGFQKSAAQFVIRSVLVRLLFILQSPNVGFDNFALIIASTAAANSRSASDNIRTIIEKTESVYVQKFHRLIKGTSSSGKFLESLSNEKQYSPTLPAVF